ncbi:hypothetical protein MVEN_00197700 [Mycena venus]|uniref:Uncharacterized protein n=1 Tax=Mycena venus TaxID=2733690 RepID=A0A8H6Z0H8_9AGAR|nr:hypothetical protein MVEN_00197700 [Mycena venus]
MPVKTHTWISLWFLLTAPVIAWDIGYCFMRPRSMEGGDLHWFWAPYSKYQKIDLLYGTAALERGDGFVNAQALLNLVETSMNLIYLYTAHITAWPPAPLIGLTAAALTLSKTILYWAQEYFCGLCSVGHNDLGDFITWILSNAPWGIATSLIIARLGKDLIDDLNVAHRVCIKDTSDKDS